MMRKFDFKVLPVALAFAALGGASITAGAQTVVNPVGNNGTERCLEGGTCPAGTSASYTGANSLQSVFSTDLSISSGQTATLARVSDSLDTLWHNVALNSGQIEARARYAGDNSSLGFTTTPGGAVSPLLAPISGSARVLVDNLSAFNPGPAVNHPGDFAQNPVSSWVTIAAAANQPFAFVLTDGHSGFKYTSNNTGGPATAGSSASLFANSAGSTVAGGSMRGEDHMVAFQVSLNGVKQQDYFIAFEDRGLSRNVGGDHDYQDYVAEVKYVAAIPEPETYAMLLAGLGLMGFVARRRRNAAA